VATTNIYGSNCSISYSSVYRYQTISVNEIFGKNGKMRVNLMLENFGIVRYFKEKYKNLIQNHNMQQNLQSVSNCSFIASLSWTASNISQTR